MKTYNSYDDSFENEDFDNFDDIDSDFDPTDIMDESIPEISDDDIMNMIFDSDLDGDDDSDKNEDDVECQNAGIDIDIPDDLIYKC